MKRIEIFECEVCKSRFESEEEALQCEKEHVECKYISKVVYGDAYGKYPSSFVVMMEDGNEVEYNLFGINQTYFTPNHDLGYKAKEFKHEGDFQF